MLKFIKIFLQFLILFIFVSWSVTSSKIVSFEFRSFIIETSTSVLLISLLVIILLFLIIQRIVFFFKEKYLRYKLNKELKISQKGYNSFLLGIVALFNQDYKKAILESKKISQYFKDESLGLLLQSETLKVEKKFDQLNDVYEKMLKNPNTKTLGLRGLMEQNFRAEDYHHAFIYAEKLLFINPKIDKLYPSIVNIISKTNNWQKLIDITNYAYKQNIIERKTFSENISIAYYEISKIKYLSSIDEAINLMEKALKLRSYFSPYVIFYISLLIKNNNLSKAKKYLTKSWSNFSHPDMYQNITVLAPAMKLSYYELAKSICKNSLESADTKILLAKSLIDDKNWENARKQLSPLLEKNPLKEVCLLMAKIEEGDTNDIQKIDSWTARSNFGKASKIWICSITGIQQEKWTAVSAGGHFNALYWEYPKNINNLGDNEENFSNMKLINQ